MKEIIKAALFVGTFGLVIALVLWLFAFGPFAPTAEACKTLQYSEQRIFCVLRFGWQ